MPWYVVQKGDCLTSLADQHGFFWETVWQDENNAPLRKMRSDPQTLSVGDQVFIPELRSKALAGATGRRHTFRRKGIPAVLRLQVFDMMRPRALESFTLTLDTGVVLHGTSDADGIVCVSIPTAALSATLVIGPDDYTMELKLGGLPPIESVEGAQARLLNLGFYDGPVDGLEGPELQKALQLYQLAYRLERSGTLDAATRAHVGALHDKTDRDPREIKAR